MNVKIMDFRIMAVWATDIRILQGLVALALVLASLPAVAQNVRYEWQGIAYIDAENQMIAERAVDKVIGARPGNNGQIIFFRPAGSVDGEFTLSSGDDASLAQLPSRAYYAIAVEPGTHTYTVDGHSLSVEVAPGERHYVKIDNDRQLSPTNTRTFLRLVTGKHKALYLD